MSLGSADARARRRASQLGGVVDRTTPLAPELCVTIGGAQVDVVGRDEPHQDRRTAAANTSTARCPGTVDLGLAALVERLRGRHVKVAVWLGSGVAGALGALARRRARTPPRSSAARPRSPPAMRPGSISPPIARRARRRRERRRADRSAARLSRLGAGRRGREPRARRADRSSSTRRAGPSAFPEVAAIAELRDYAQLTHVVALAPDGALIHASRIAGKQLQTVRVRGECVIGVRIAGSHVEEYPTPMPSPSMRRLDLAAIGLDPMVLAHRALPPRAAHHAKKSVERIAEHLSVHLVKR